MKKTKIMGTKSRPRVRITRSNKHIFVQFIDDQSQNTLLSGNDKNVKLTKESEGKEGILGTKVLRAFALGEELAKKAKGKKITTAVFDRGKYRYHGRVKALAEGLRKGGIKI